MDISSVTTGVAPDLLESLAILSETTVRKSAVNWEDLKSYWKSENKPHFLGDQQACYKFFKDFTKHRKKTNKAVVFSHAPFSNILKYWDYRRNLPTIWKTILVCLVHPAADDDFLYVKTHLLDRC